MTDKPSFIFYRSFYEAVSSLDDLVRVRLFDAICAYALNGVEPEFDGIEKAVFTLVKPQLDANAKRYENGRKGGRPAGENNQTKTKPKPKNNQTKTKGEPNVNVNENVNVDKKDNPNGLSKKAGGLSSLDELRASDLNGPIEAWFSENAKSVDRYVLRNKLVAYCESKGKSYKDYFAAMRSWALKEQAEKTPDRPKTYVGLFG